jgi:ankyrin repeat protein
MTSYDLIDHYNFKDTLSKWLGIGISTKVPDDLIMSTIKGLPIGTKLDLNGLFICACAYSSDELLKYLLTIGADKDSLSRINSTPIMFLAERKNLAMIKYLVELGANIFALNDNGRDAVFYAKRGGAMDVVQYIDGLRSINIKQMKQLEEKNKDLEDKLNQLMEKLESMTVSDNPDPRSKKRPRVDNKFTLIVKKDADESAPKDLPVDNGVAPMAI